MDTLTAVGLYLERLHPDASNDQRERRLQELIANPPAPHWYLPDSGSNRRIETAVVNVWRELTLANAEAYARVVLGDMRRVRGLEGKAQYLDDVNYPRPEQEMYFGPYVADASLGHGGDGRALHARHGVTGQDVTIKLPARGDRLVYWALQVDREPWPETIIWILDEGRPDPPAVLLPWVAREYADGTLHDEVRRRGHLPVEEALAVFRVCCEAVAWLHDHHIYRWSAHVKNVFRVGDQWKIGDLGRCLVFREFDDPLLIWIRQPYFDALVGDDDVVQHVAEWLLEREYWGQPTTSLYLAYNAERERRLRLDDCSVLAGLLVDLLTGKRWEWFFRALNKRPYCSAHYALTGDRDVDEQLSAVVNRAWRGDAGGVLLLANQGRGEQTIYDDARELLADVEAIFSSRVGVHDLAIVAGREEVLKAS